MDRREFLKLAGMFGTAVVTAPKTIFGAEQKISDITTVINDNNFNAEVYRHKGKAIVLFYANWDERSKKMFPLYTELVREYGNKVKFCSYELDESYDPNRNTEAWKRGAKLKNNYGVDLIPTTNMYVNGKLTDNVRGCPSEKVPEKIIKEFIVKWIEK